MYILCIIIYIYIYIYIYIHTTYRARSGSRPCVRTAILCTHLAEFWWEFRQKWVVCSCEESHGDFLDPCTVCMHVCWRVCVCVCVCVFRQKWVMHSCEWSHESFLGPHTVCMHLCYIYTHISICMCVCMYMYIYIHCEYGKHVSINTLSVGVSLVHGCTHMYACIYTRICVHEDT
jgi:hypothetical protein